MSTSHVARREAVLALATTNGDPNAAAAILVSGWGETTDSVPMLPTVELVSAPEGAEELYSVSGTTWALCKICYSADKDRRIDPCEHLLCGDCAQGIARTSLDVRCPFCRGGVDSCTPVRLV